ncbi:hypothetical protein V1507DRAFT_463510 [Lipomyces tetrasporus]
MLRSELLVVFLEWFKAIVRTQSDLCMVYFQKQRKVFALLSKIPSKTTTWLASFLGRLFNWIVILRNSHYPRHTRI